MNIGLIGLSGVRVQDPELSALGLTMPGFVRRGRVIASLPNLGLLTVAGLTPREHAVTYLEVADARAPRELRGTTSRASATESTEFKESMGTGGGAGGEARAGAFVELPEFDLVGVSSLTAQIDEAYRVADAYRRRGTRVVMGGLHVSALPEEALAHCDAVVVGGAEDAWPRVVADAARGRLERRYDGAREGVFEPGRYVAPRYDLLAGRAYNRVTVQTSRGCPRDCEFCGASLRITDRFQQKPVDRVIAEVREAKRHARLPFLEFADDNTFLNRAWSRDFLAALEREEVRWFTETDVSVADDAGVCDRLARAGCRQVLIGFESPRAGDLAGLDPGDWKRRVAGGYRRVIDTLQSRGVSVNGCFVLGLDAHGPEVFPEVLEFVRGSGLAEVQYTVLTPFPGTPLRERLRREGRLPEERYWDRCTLFDVCHEPARMSRETLAAGLRWLMQETYSREATSRRARSFLGQRGVASSSRRDDGR